MIHDFTEYLNYDEPKLFERLALVTSDLANLHEELAMVQAQVVRETASVMQAAEVASSSGRRDHVTMTVVEPKATVIELEAQRDALVEEKFFLIRLIERT